MGALPSPEEQQDFEDLMKEKASDRLYRLENGLALNLEEVTVENMVIVDHGEIDEHGLPFYVARKGHIYDSVLSHSEIFSRAKESQNRGCCKIVVQHFCPKSNCRTKCKQEK